MTSEELTSEEQNLERKLRRQEAIRVLSDGLLNLLLYDGPPTRSPRVTSRPVGRKPKERK